MRRLFGKRKAQIPHSMDTKPHMTVKVATKPELVEDEYPLEKIEEFRKLGKRPYRNGVITQTFIKWYDDNRT